MDFAAYRNFHETTSTMDKTRSFAGSWRRKAQHAEEAYHDRKPIRKITQQDRTWGDFEDNKTDDDIPIVKRWDGQSRTAEEWDSLKRDPDLYFDDGNCLVHLHAQNTSKRGPSFKVPLSSLLTADCSLLIARFLPNDPQHPVSRSPRDIKRFLRSYGKNSSLSLYITPSHTPLSSKSEVFNYHLATRNFFAWVFRKPLVGAHLGQAMVGLLNSIHEFRDGLGDNVADMMEYLEYIGYDKIANSPDYALAMLHFSKHFQMRELFVRAVAHCVGMHERLHKSSEWQYVDQEMKGTLKAVHLDLKSRVYRAGSSLKNFLEDELSEAYIGLPAGARAHLERFRQFLINYYYTQLGYFPPQNFDSDLLRMMREDVEALYDLLVDSEYSINDSMPSIAVGGICTLQAVNDFDAAMGMETLDHPLPLLPHVAENPKQRRISRMISRSNLRQPDSRLLTHTALIKATNWRDTSFRNPLVQAYRKFEEVIILEPSKRTGKERVTLVDARKVRWIMVYGLYQTLKSVTDEPECIRDDEDCEYHLAINEDLIPEWRQKQSLGFLVRSQTDMVTRSSSLVGTADTHGWRASAQLKAEAPLVEEDEEKIEIEPDVDYFALTHKSSEGSPQEVLRTKSIGAKDGRSNSFSRAMSLKKGMIRRSMIFFKTATMPSTPAIPADLDTNKTAAVSDDDTSARRAQQDVNGDTHHVDSLQEGYIECGKIGGDQNRSPQQDSLASWASRSDSTASKGTNITTISEAESSGSDDLSDSAVQTTIPEASEDDENRVVAGEDHPTSQVQWDAMPPPLKSKRRDVVSMIIPTPSRRASLRRPLSGVFDLNTSFPPPSPYGTQTTCYSPNAIHPPTSYSPSSSPIDTTFDASSSLPRSNSFSFTSSLSRSNSSAIPRNNSSSFGISRSNSFLVRTAALKKSLVEKGKDVDSRRRISEDFEVVMDERDEWRQMANWLDGGEEGDKQKIGDGDEEEEEEGEDLMMGGGNGLGKKRTEGRRADVWGDYAELGGLTETK